MDGHLGTVIRDSFKVFKLWLLLTMNKRLSTNATEQLEKRDKTAPWNNLLVWL